MNEIRTQTPAQRNAQVLRISRSVGRAEWRYGYICHIVSLPYRRPPVVRGRGDQKSVTTTTRARESARPFNVIVCRPQRPVLYSPPAAAVHSVQSSSPRWCWSMLPSSVRFIRIYILFESFGCPFSFLSVRMAG